MFCDVFIRCRYFPSFPRFFFPKPTKPCTRRPILPCMYLHTHKPAHLRSRTPYAYPPYTHTYTHTCAHVHRPGYNCGVKVDDPRDTDNSLCTTLGVYFGAFTWHLQTNDWEDNSGASCNYNEIVTGFYGYHDNGKEDRLYYLKCTRVSE